MASLRRSSTGSGKGEVGHVCIWPFVLSITIYHLSYTTRCALVIYIKRYLLPSQMSITTVFVIR